MALWERLASDGDVGSPEKITVHVFSVALRELARGAVTRQQITNVFNLGAEENTELDALEATYLGLNADQKRDYLVLIHDVFLLIEAGLYNEATAKSRLGF